jgi:NADH-quinone oxidoreductase subunit M
VDAAHRVHHQPGLYFALVLVLEAGLFGSFHGAELLPLVFVLGAEPDSRLLPHQACGAGTKRGPAATQFFVYTMAGSVALLVSFLAIFLFPPAAWTFVTSRCEWPRPANWSRWSRRIWVR